jgi:epoxyqueuosine reductase
MPIPPKTIPAAEHSAAPGIITGPDFRAWLDGEALALGFDRLRIADTDLGLAPERLRAWLAAGYHGEMGYMERHAALRFSPELLQPGALRVICVSMNYAPDLDIDAEWNRIASPGEAVISVYARGRDYHKVLRQRLQELASRIEAHIGPFGYRVFTDSAPLMEVELAQKAGLGWRGKHTLLLNRESGSVFFLGEILLDLPLPVDAPIEPHCGTCSACIDVCPTAAITAPYVVDARRCISYLTIENPGPIPLEFRVAIGNRVYGCDDCQLACPWNKFAQATALPDFAERNGMGGSSLLELWSWTATDFERRHEGSAIRRIGYSRWRRNLAVAMGNALRSDKSSPEQKLALRSALQADQAAADVLVQEHIDWALEAPFSA